MRRTGEAPETGRTVPATQKAGKGAAKKPPSKELGAGGVGALLKQVTSVLEDYKAQDIVAIPLAGQADFADYLVIASGTSTRHVASMGQALDDKLGKEILGIEGLQDGEWVCADLGDIVVHVFVPEKRTLYNLEKLWSHVFAPAT